MVIKELGGSHGSGMKDGLFTDLLSLYAFRLCTYIMLYY